MALFFFQRTNIKIKPSQEQTLAIIMAFQDSKNTPDCPLTGMLSMTIIFRTNHWRKLILSDPKSGNQTEMVFIPKKVAERLREYIASVKIGDDHSVFPIGYTRAREIVQNAGKMVGVSLNPHDLRRMPQLMQADRGCQSQNLLFQEWKTMLRIFVYLHSRNLLKLLEDKSM